MPAGILEIEAKPRDPQIILWARSQQAKRQSSPLRHLKQNEVKTSEFESQSRVR